MPGSTSDSFDPEFTTLVNARAVEYAMQTVVEMISNDIGGPLKDILEVIRGETGPLSEIQFSERELRIIRFGLNRAMESI